MSASQSPHPSPNRFAPLPSSSTFLLPVTQAADLPPTEELPPPRSPYPWRWRCHRCHIWYDLHCTRRCLECSHYFCSRPSHSSSRSKKQRRNNQGVCTSQFDYVAWSRWGSWRRTISAQRERYKDQQSRLAESSRSALIPGLNLGVGAKRKASTLSSNETHLYEVFATYEFRARTEEGDENVWVRVSHDVEEEVEYCKQKLFCSGKYDCSLHCDSPSECVHKKYAAKVAGRGPYVPLRVPAGARKPSLEMEKLRQDRRLGVLGTVVEEEEHAEGPMVDDASSGSDADGNSDLEKELQRQVWLFLSEGGASSELVLENDISKAVTTDLCTIEHDQLSYKLDAGTAGAREFSTTTDPDFDVDMDD